MKSRVTFAFFEGSYRRSKIGKLRTDADIGGKTMGCNVGIHLWLGGIGHEALQLFQFRFQLFALFDLSLQLSHLIKIDIRFGTFLIAGYTVIVIVFSLNFFNSKAAGGQKSNFAFQCSNAIQYSHRFQSNTSFYDYTQLYPLLYMNVKGITRGITSNFTPVHQKIHIFRSVRRPKQPPDGWAAACRRWKIPLFAKILHPDHDGLTFSS